MDQPFVRLRRIETEAVLSALRTPGVGFGQGFLLGLPGPLPAISS